MKINSTAHFSCLGDRKDSFLKDVDFRYLGILRRRGGFLQLCAHYPESLALELRSEVAGTM